jgi:hypothetical protein
MDWRKINLPPVDPGVSPEPGLFQLQLSEIYAESGHPEDFCVFLARDQLGNRTIYFSPVAVVHCAQWFRDISHAHEIYECDAPIGGDVIIGSDFFNCLKLLS